MYHQMGEEWLCEYVCSAEIFVLDESPLSFWISFCIFLMCISSKKGNGLNEESYKICAGKIAQPLQHLPLLYTKETESWSPEPM